MSDDQRDLPAETITKKPKRRRATFPFEILPDDAPDEDNGSSSEPLLEDPPGA